jgi:hypothetical protein
MHWKYHVPSTGYQMEEDVRLDSENQLSGDCFSTSPDGTVNTRSDTWSRIGDDEP